MSSGSGLEPVVPRNLPGDAGLQSSSIDTLRARYGYNEVPEHRESLALLYLKNFWGPLPWALELTILITFLVGKQAEAAVIILLFLLNAGINIYQHRSASAALAALRKNIQISARAKRDGVWVTLPARELLPGDVIRLQAGDVAPADATLIEGALSVDLSMLSGESLPKDSKAGEEVFSGGIIRRGEATALAERTGADTRFGMTAGLIETSHAPTHMEQVIFSVIKYFFFVNIVLIVIIVLFGAFAHAPNEQILNFAIVLLLMSVPVAFPAMFAVAQSYGALQLGEYGTAKVLVRRLGAVQDGAMMDVLCSDKTGTLTTNHVTVGEITRYGTADDARILALAGICSDEADSDSIDNAIFERIASDTIPLPARTHFEPFDPATKQTRAAFIDRDGSTRIALMGLPEALLSPDVGYAAEALADVSRFSGKGFRVLAVVESGPDGKQCDGLITLSDPIRPDAPGLIRDLAAAGIRTVMITGDGRQTAGAVAAELGLAGDVCTPEDLRADPSIALHASVFAEAFPENKIAIIQALQHAGHVVGMTGDGVNDAPALRQAEIGIAVESAVDVAKQSASLILTSPGLGGVLHMITVSREVYSRLHTWALNKIIKSIEVVIFTAGIFFMTRSYILSPLLAVLLLFANDFISISLATDRTGSVSRPVHWDVGRLILGSSILATAPLLCMTITYGIAHLVIGYPFDTLRTVAYISLVYYGITTLLSIRAWPSGLSVRPSRTLLLAILFSFVFTLLVGASGFIVTPVSLSVIALIVATAALNFFIIEALKRLSLVQQLLGVSF
ncbi:MAG TPA: HAD-IC family P-type ATPase [Candidatus Paceibacterota bacterium]|nr:HAD-IC family P-type ATPase [Candidatus Paceibacterota bacterium]